jgi:hypothetical protein
MSDEFERERYKERIRAKITEEASHSPAPRRTKTMVKGMQRERKSPEGIMLQIDTSPHDWLEGRATEDGIYWTRLMTPLAGRLCSVSTK